METDNTDGDLYLIKKIKEKPVIWNPKHELYHDRGQRNKVFQQLSCLTKMEVNFLKRRWTTIRERYVRELRNEKLQNTKSKYKYMQELSFLRNFVKIKRMENENEISQSESPETKTEMFEFEITEEDLKEDNDKDLSDIFIELHENKELDETQTIEQHPSYLIEDIISDKSEMCGKLISNPCLHFENNVGNFKAEQLIEVIEVPEVDTMPLMPAYQTKHITTVINDSNDLITEPTIVQNSIINRNEDTIFGELIASQLMKITDETKKREIKRNILALFF